MKWFKNLKVRVKLLISFCILIVFSIIVAAIGAKSVNDVNNNYSYLMNFPQERVEKLLSIQTDFAMMRYRSANFVMNSGDLEMINNTLLPQYNEAYSSFKTLLEQYIKLNNDDIKRDQEIKTQNRENAYKLQDMIQQYDKQSNEVLELSRANKPDEADAVLKGIIPLSGQINTLIKDMINPVIEYKNDVEKNAANSAGTAVLYLVLLTVSLVIIGLALAFYIGSSISKSIKGLSKAAGEIAIGNLEISLASNTKDEIGDLTRNLDVVVNAISSLISDLSNMAVLHNEKGAISHFIDENKYNGAYSDVVKHLNNMASGHIETTRKAMDCLGKMAGGDFDVSMEPMPGEKAFINDAIEEMRTNIKGVGSEITILTNEAIKGNLSIRTRTENFKGGWADIMKRLNEVLLNITEPVLESTDALQKLSNGDLSVKVKTVFKGDLALLSNALNSTTEALSDYIKDISYVLGEIASANLNLNITGEYVGDFKSIKESMNVIIEQLNNTIGSISTATEQVFIGAKSISESSVSLASGATEQASSIQELTATIDTINEKTRKNAEDANTANRLSESSKKNALSGNEEMNKMLDSMESIKESSNNISKIIKTIDDIAFQTNLLALNAAVEAARAGEHGKGFAVVAEEVRNLAGRSQTAAKETAAMIEDSIIKVTEGTKIAQTTAQSLKTIVDDINEVSGIIYEIAASSSEQAEAISQVTIGLNQISEVVQVNSATSEETASASQELSSQSETLSDMVTRFKLKRAN